MGPCRGRLALPSHYDLLRNRAEAGPLCEDGIPASWDAAEPSMRPTFLRTAIRLSGLARRGRGRPLVGAALAPLVLLVVLPLQRLLRGKES